jgi:hypothetical protein
MNEFKRLVFFNKLLRMRGILKPFAHLFVQFKRVDRFATALLKDKVFYFIKNNELWCIKIYLNIADSVPNFFAKTKFSTMQWLGRIAIAFNVLNTAIAFVTAFGPFVVPIAPSAIHWIKKIFTFYNAFTIYAPFCNSFFLFALLKNEITFRKT